MVSRELETKVIEAQLSIADSLKGINDTLKLLNDQNILHATRNEEQHKSIIEKLKVLTEKYWWLIIVLVGAILVIAGFKQAASLLIPM